jgi:hypothetical protein
MLESSHKDVKRAILGFWIAAQICLEQICINPKGMGQDSPL